MKLHLKTLLNNHGNSIISSLALILIVASSGAAIVQLRGTDQSASVNQLAEIQAKGIANAAAQIALKTLDEGYSPDIDNKFMGHGSYNIDTRPSTDEVYVKGSVRDSNVSMLLTTDFTEDCINENYLHSNMSYGNEGIYQLKLNKHCHSAGILTHMSVTWDWSTCAQAVACPIQNDGAESPPPGKMWICHASDSEDTQIDGINLAIDPEDWGSEHDTELEEHANDHIGQCDNSIILSKDTCYADDNAIIALDQCPQYDGGAKIKTIKGTSGFLYKAGSIPDANAPNISSGEVIDIEEMLMEENGNEHEFKILFTQKPVEGGWYRISLNFADGSVSVVRVRIGVAESDKDECPKTDPYYPDCDDDDGNDDEDNDYDGYTPNEGDCDDNNPYINPYAYESCYDYIDNNCNGQVDEYCGTDLDGDGYTTSDGDCDDYNWYVNPGATEQCFDYYDNNCNGQIDEGCAGKDADGDGYSVDAGDCNDYDYYTNPGATEQCFDYYDNNCDGQIDENCQADDDLDGDGYNTYNGGDCNDNDASINPGVPETCDDGIDNNCDGNTDEFCDMDLDGYSVGQGDCNDNDSYTNPSSPEHCYDSIDNNCDGQVNEGCSNSFP